MLLRDERGGHSHVPAVFVALHVDISHQLSCVLAVRVQGYSAALTLLIVLTVLDKGCVLELKALLVRLHLALLESVNSPLFLPGTDEKKYMKILSTGHGPSEWGSPCSLFIEGADNAGLSVPAFAGSLRS